MRQPSSTISGRPRSISKRFRHRLWYAIRGIGFAISTQKSMRTHLLCTGIPILAGIYFSLSSIEWMILIMTISFVLITETINSAVEVSIDLVTRKLKYRAMIAKDMAAGAVLIASINAVIVGYLLFFDRFVTLLNA